MTQLSERFDEALAFASALHRTQVRKGVGVPYVSHLLAVTALVLEDGGDEDQAIAALLHDAIEDQGKHYPGGRDALRAVIRARFGDAVLEIVNACTDDEGYHKSDWRARKQAYLDRLPRESPAALRVSCADKLHNARTCLADYREAGEALWPRFRAGRDDQFWYYRALVAVFNHALPGRLATELQRTVDEWERLARNP